MKTEHGISGLIIIDYRVIGNAFRTSSKDRDCVIEMVAVSK